MRSHDFYSQALFDPATLTALGTAATIIGGVGAAGAAANSIFNKPKAPSLPGAPPPQQSPTGTPNTNAPNGVGPSFLAAAATPGAGQTGGKSFLGS